MTTSWRLAALLLVACGGAAADHTAAPARSGTMDSRMADGMAMPVDPESAFAPLEVGTRQSTR